ncbi:hypothetical protein WA577_004426 [Blastocystis sp. JDR]
MEVLYIALALIILLVLAVGTLWLLSPILKSNAHTKCDIHASETVFFNPITNKEDPFPSLDDDATLALSVIVPAYNEEKRLPKMLDECIAYLMQRESEHPNFTWEIIIVDDGSRDRTKEIGWEYAKRYNNPNIRVLVEYHNRGKGGAIRMGICSCRGRYILMADADGATTFSEIEKLEEALNSGYDVAVGSRNHIKKNAVAQRAWYRNVLMYGFNFLVVVLSGVHGISDTQCGFKLFTRRASRSIFSSLHLERWAFDVEVLYIASRLGYSIAELPVRWMEIEGSKVNIVLATISMFRDMVATRLAYVLHIWTLPKEDKKHM